MAGLAMEPSSATSSLDYGGHSFGYTSQDYKQSNPYDGQSVFPQNEENDEVYQSFDQRLRASNEASSFEDFFASEAALDANNAHTSGLESASKDFETSPESGWNKFRSNQDDDSDDSSVDMDLMDKYSGSRMTSSMVKSKNYSSKDPVYKSNQQDLFSLHLTSKSSELTELDQFSSKDNEIYRSGILKAGQSYETKASVFKQEDLEGIESDSEVTLSPSEVESDHNFTNMKSKETVANVNNAKLPKPKITSFEAWKDHKNEVEKDKYIAPESQRSESPVSLSEFVPEEGIGSSLQASYKEREFTGDYRDKTDKSKQPYGDIPHGNDGLLGMDDDDFKGADILETDRTTDSLNTEVLLRDLQEKVLVSSNSKSNVIKSVPQKSVKVSTKSASYNTDATRKYQSYLNGKTGAKSQNALKRDFVNEMLSRAQEKNRDDGYYKSYNEDGSESVETSGEYSKKYPRGVTLSKTFTKASNYKSGSLKWNSGKYEELSYGPRNIFNNKKYNNSKTTNLTKYSHPDVTSKGWTVHEQQNGNNHDVNGASDLAQNDNDVNTSIIDEKYYKDILKSSKISKPSESSGEIDIEIPESVHNKTYTKPIRPASASNVKSRPASAYLKNNKKPKTVQRPESGMSVYRPESALSTIRPDSVLSTIRPDSALSTLRPDSALSVEGVKQDTGPPRKPKSAVGRYRTNHTPSYIDETLFGKAQPEPSFKAPWGEPDRVGKKPLPYVAITSMEPHLDRKTEPPKQPSSAPRQTETKHRPVSASTKKKQTKELSKFHNTYVDEMLFGKQVVEPSFKAPWDKGNQPKPYAFDGTNYRSTDPVKVQVKKQSNEPKKPVWK